MHVWVHVVTQTDAVVPPLGHDGPVYMNSCWPTSQLVQCMKEHVDIKRPAL